MRREASSTATALRGVIRTELLGLVRDRRALFSAFVLPILLYPLLFLGQGWLAEVAEESMEAKEVRIALELSQAPASMQARVHELLLEQPPIQLRELPPDALAAVEECIDEGTEESWQRERELVQGLLAQSDEAVLHARPDPVVPRRTLFRLHYDGANDTSKEASSRAREALRQLEAELRTGLIETLLDSDPAAPLELESFDLASDEDLGGAFLGRILPLIAVLVLLSGGSYTALAAFAGERESGTLETLLVQPVSASVFVWGKFLVVIFTGLLTLVLNLGSLLASLAFGLGSVAGLGGEVSGPGVGRVLLAGLIFVPVCVLLCALLCFFCGRARSFREGQHYVLPLSLAAMVPAALAMQPTVELDAFLACIPLAGPALAFRDAMVGRLELLPGVLAFSSTWVWAVLVLRHLGSLLDGERVLAGRSTEAEDAQRKVQSRQALAFGFAGVLGVYLVGGLLQSGNALWGLVATLWLVLPLFTWFSARGTARRAGESIPRVLGLSVPAVPHALGALLLAPALARLADYWIRWQQSVLPLPSSMLEGGEALAVLTDLSPLALFLVVALSPGICEELFFRGAVLSGLRRDMPAWKVVLWQAILFGLVHASIYRFAPTAVLGAILAAVTLRSRSLVPAILLHVAYNGVLVLGAAEPWFESAWLPWLAVPGVALLLLGRRTRGNEDAASSPPSYPVSR